MYYELRLYKVAHGRVANELERIKSVAYDGAPAEPYGPPVEARSLFDIYGVPRPVGVWTAMTGPTLPMICQVMVWKDLAQRDETFMRFFSDPRWIAVREKTADGHVLVEHYNLSLMRAAAAWEALREPDDLARIGGVHELRILPVVAGSPAEAGGALAAHVLPRARAAGARLIGMFDVVAGPDLPAMVTWLAWPDLQARTCYLEEAGAQPSPADRVFGPPQVYLMDPQPWGCPRPNFASLS